MLIGSQLEYTITHPPTPSRIFLGSTFENQNLRVIFHVPLSIGLFLSSPYHVCPTWFLPLHLNPSMALLPHGKVLPLFHFGFSHFPFRVIFTSHLDQIFWTRPVLSWHVGISIDIRNYLPVFWCFLVSSFHCDFFDHAVLFACNPSTSSPFLPFKIHSSFKAEIFELKCLSHLLRSPLPQTFVQPCFPVIANLIAYFKSTLCVPEGFVYVIYSWCFENSDL